MNIIRHASFLGPLVFYAGPTLATVAVQARPVAGWQVSDAGVAAAGVRVLAQTDKTSMSVAGGFTVMCEESFGSIEWQRSETGEHFGGFATEVKVPEQPPGEYAVPRFNTWVSGVEHVCEFKWKGLAKEGSYQVTGSGWRISLGFGQGGEEAVDVGTMYFPMIRQDASECSLADFCCIP
jgi:hypothetical protein